MALDSVQTFQRMFEFCVGLRTFPCPKCAHPRSADPRRITQVARMPRLLRHPAFPLAPTTWAPYLRPLHHPRKSKDIHDHARTAHTIRGRGHRQMPPKLRVPSLAEWRTQGNPTKVQGPLVDRKLGTREMASGRMKPSLNLTREPRRPDRLHESIRSFVGSLDPAIYRNHLRYGPKLQRRRYIQSHAGCLDCSLIDDFDRSEVR